MKPITCFHRAITMVAGTALLLWGEPPTVVQSPAPSDILFAEEVSPAQLRREISLASHEEPLQIKNPVADSSPPPSTRTAALRDELDWQNLLSPLEILPRQPVPRTGKTPLRDPHAGPADRLEFPWEAANLAHRRLFFEDAALERYGLGRGPVVQPVVSGCRLAIDTLKMALRGRRCPAGELEYTLGYPRPGSQIPSLR